MAAAVESKKVIPNSPSPGTPTPSSPAMETLEQRDWARLPPELLESIADRITQIADLVRFSAVCKSFPSLLPPQFPWLILPNDEKTRSHLVFFNPGDDNRNRTYKIPLPEALWTRRRMDYSGAGGWLLTFQDRETLALFNYLTHSSISLPPLPSTYGRRAYSQMKAKLLGSDLFAVLFPLANAIFLCGLRDSSWRRIQGERYDSDTDFVYHDGSLFVRSCNEIKVFDPHTCHRLDATFIPPGSVRDYLVESPQRKFLLVRRKYKSDSKRFEVFRLDSRDKRTVYVKLTSIGDNVLFVDDVQAMAFSAGDFEGCRRNCIYFVDDLGEEGDKGVMLFDIKKGQVEHAPLFSFTSKERGHWGRARWAVPLILLK